MRKFKLVLAIAVLTVSSVATAASYRPIDPIHRLLCKVAVEELPKEVRSIKECLRDYPLQHTRMGKQIEIYSCIYGELFRITYDESTGQAMIGSEGAECD